MIKIRNTYQIHKRFSFGKFDKNDFKSYLMVNSLCLLAFMDKQIVPGGLPEQIIEYIKIVV